MPIDKIIPRFLVSDKDERLLKEGAMTDAINVTISQAGDNDEGVVKNVKGTISATASSAGDAITDSSVKVIGSISDSSRGFIYFFVADVADPTQGANNAIYQYNTSNDEYKIVMRAGYLDFDPNGFVKADIINADIQQDGTVQTLLYFTDNDNPPRKINVDRALASGYFGENDFDFLIQSIKAANTFPPTIAFETDSSVEQNNFQENAFQFATQLIYKDGEESAISSYSKLAVSQASIFGGLEVESYGVQTYTQNVCVIKHNAPNINDVKRIRLLARNGNNGAWFVVEEINPDENIFRDVIGSQVKVYDKDSGEYRFYNDRLGAPVDLAIVDKTYDNVPLKAKGQAIAGNRLMYSDYVEGFENASSVKDVTLTVKYSDVATGSASLIPATDYANVISQNSTKPNIDIDLLAGDAFGSLATSNTVVAAGTRVELSFVFDPTFTITGAASADIIDFNVIAYYTDDDYSYNPNLEGNVTATTLDLDTLHSSSTGRAFSVSTFLSEDKTVNEVATLLAGLVDEEDITLRYENVSMTVEGGSLTSATQIDGDLNVTFKMGEVTSASNGAWILKPRITGMAWVEGVSGVTGTGVGYDYFFDSDNSALTNCYARAGNTQSEIVYSSVNTDYVEQEKAIAETQGATPTFKSGSSYSLGVVYYDKFGRHGFVNELGNVFIDHIATRSSNYGPASIEVDFDDLSTYPSFADSYQIVCTESSLQSVFQYTAGGAYVKRDLDSDADPRPVDTTSKQIYVSLLTLDRYKQDKDFLRDYSYTKGDKLRVISRRNDAGDGFVYPKASDNTVIEFDVVGVKTFADDDENLIRIDGSSGATYSGGEDDPHVGTFLVIESPSIVAGVDGTDGNNLKYVGYDWYSITNQAYPDSGGSPTNANYWNRETLFEIVTPRKSTAQKIYYEIGERRRVGTYKDASLAGKNHGPAFVINSGDVHYRAISARTPVYNAGWKTLLTSTSEEDPTTWVYKAKYVEDQSVSDSFSSKSWDRGRPHVVYDKAAEQRRRNGITYSDAYAEDAANLSLSSFNASRANFDSVDLRYGALEFIGNFNDDIVAVQENKLCLIPVGKNILEYAGGSADVAVSTNVLGARRYSSGDYGCVGHPESVLIQDNMVFFVDTSRKAVLSLTGGQLVPISEKGMSSFFEDFFDSGNTRYVSGYDPRDNTYYITGTGSGSQLYRTVGYDAARGNWKSRYSFAPTCYANQNNMLYSTYHNSTLEELFYRHDDSSNYNKFYGARADSEVEVVSKMSPSRVKVFNAVSYESDSNNWEMEDGATTNLSQTSGIIHDAAGSDTPKFVEKEGAYYAAMPKDTAVKYVYAGTFSSSAQNVITVTDIARIDRFPFLLDQTQLHYLSSGTYEAVTNVASGSVVNSFDLSASTITTTQNATEASPGDKLFFKVSTDGDAMRGSFLKLRLTLDSAAADDVQELYCINVHLTDSKSHHPLGQ